MIMSFMTSNKDCGRDRNGGLKHYLYSFSLPLP